MENLLGIYKKSKFPSKPHGKQLVLEKSIRRSTCWFYHTFSWYPQIPSENGSLGRTGMEYNFPNQVVTGEQGFLVSSQKNNSIIIK